jgi:hypothetical protein
MIFGLGKKKKDRHVVATALVAVDGDAFTPLLTTTSRAASAIVKSDGDFDVAAEKLAEVARALLDHEASWSAAALGGDVFDDEGDAAAQVSEVWADLSSRYRSSGDGDGDDAMPRAAGDDTSRERRCVVMLQASYIGEREDIERELHDRLDLARALRGMVALGSSDALTSVHLHIAPAHPDDRLTDEQLLALFPELNSI